jgi:hypothetical protein
MICRGPMVSPILRGPHQTPPRSPSSAQSASHRRNGGSPALRGLTPLIAPSHQPGGTGGTRQSPWGRIWGAECETPNLVAPGDHRVRRHRTTNAQRLTGGPVGSGCTGRSGSRAMLLAIAALSRLDQLLPALVVIVPAVTTKVRSTDRANGLATPRSAGHHRPSRRIVTPI